MNIYPSYSDPLPDNGGFPSLFSEQRESGTSHRLQALLMCNIAIQNLLAVDVRVLPFGLASVKNQAVRELELLRQRLCSEDIESDGVAVAFNKIREGFRLAGLFSTFNSWQSPTYDYSSNPQVGQDSYNVSRSRYQYRRDYHKASEAYEQDFLELYRLEELNKASEFFCRAYLTNSGMSAFVTSLFGILMGIPEDGLIAVEVACYHECKHILLESISNRIVLFDASDPDNTSSVLGDPRVAAVFLDTLTNSYVIRRPSLHAVVNTLNTRADELFLVLDNTCLSIALDIADLRKTLRKGVDLIIHESAVKYYQYGSDLVSAGVVLAIGDPVRLSDFYRVRAKCGTNITDVSAATLPKVTRHPLAERLSHMSSNMSQLCSMLDLFVKRNPKLQDTFRVVRPPSGGFSFTSSGLENFAGTCFHLEFSDRSLTEEHAHTFIEASIDAARTLKVVLHAGASFGFAATRLCLVGANNKHTSPFIRVACGIEESSSIPLLAEALGTGLLSISKDKVQDQ